MNGIPEAFWCIKAPELLQQLQSTSRGLSDTEAKERLSKLGRNLLKPKKRTGSLTLLLAQFKSPIILILIFAASLSFILHDPTDAIIILSIVIISGFLGFWQERRATDGETYPVEKVVGILPAEMGLSQRTNTLFMGTHVVSGSAKALVVRTGKDTELGKVSERLRLRAPETEFESGVRRFGYFLMEITLILVIGIFAANVLLARPVLDSFLFALALAVGLTPQLLPAIISINLSHGASRMAEQKVIVKRLSSIENFGSMNILCSDKTGTLTEGVVRLHASLDIDGKESEKVLHFAYLNASFETGFTNPIDEAVRSLRQFDLSGYQKLDELPYDFIRKRLSILLFRNGKRIMITKGALLNVLSVCSAAEAPDGALLGIEDVRGQILTHYEELSTKGFRTFANTLKYVFMATSASFGNMFSMAGASLFLPFLPLLPKQILLTNLMTDFPEVTIAGDSVDDEMIQKPRRWNIKFIRNFMLTFGSLSSLFDYLTFGVLILVFHASTEQFRTGWFMESVISACLIVLVIRSRRPFFKSRPGRYLLLASFVIVVCALVMPFSPVGKLFGFTPLAPFFIIIMLVIVGAFIISAEILKRSFYQKVKS